MINLKIDPEFQSQIPPLTDDEFKQLEENMLSVNWCRPSMWMPRISPAESGCSTSILSMMGWGISLWMNWKQKKRRDRSHAKSAPLRELLQILFYGNSALGNSLLYISLSSVAFGRVRPAGHTLFLFCPQSSNP